MLKWPFEHSGLGSLFYTFAACADSPRRSSSATSRATSGRATPPTPTPRSGTPLPGLSSPLPRSSNRRDHRTSHQAAALASGLTALPGFSTLYPTEINMVVRFPHRFPCSPRAPFSATGPTTATTAANNNNDTNNNAAHSTHTHTHAPHTPHIPAGRKQPVRPDSTVPAAALTRRSTSRCR